MRRLLLVAVLAAVMAVASAGAAFAGEVTGNGKNLWTSTTVDSEGAAHHTLHGKSPCAFSGQEDAQFYTEPGGVALPEAEVTKGEPAHAQSWGQISKDFRDFLTSIGEHPGMACNPTHGGEEPS